MPVALYIELHYQSSFWVHEPLTTAHRPSYLVPPPTTLVGALSYGIARVLHTKGRNDLGELAPGDRTSLVLRRVAKAVNHVFYSQLDGYAAIVEDITRFFQGPYVRSENVIDPQQRWGVKVSAKIYLPGARAAIIYVFRGDLSELNIDEDTLVRGAYSIKRIGSLESIVTIDRVEVLEVEEKPFDEDAKDRFVEQETHFYIEIGNVRVDPMNWVVMSLPTHKHLDAWLKGDVRKACTQFLVPMDRYLASMRIVAPFTWGAEAVEPIVEGNRSVFEGMNCYIARIDGKELVLPYPRS